ncbi:FtsX-like permease family protein [Streptomyces wuyuanensis]|uniref:FtsX-like permease family protein n=1 Tax=Streptomyces wuyuanensis TaxID=1196353 RepID=A0A1G9ZR70_9ACTN|nr:ABC transporter permease [Streptomyces wuyuanensis]SDN24082.1 FtsX-like permease family protein [Streptomyces wuyuanensis]
MAGFVLLRARGHRLLLAAALLAIVLTTAVLTTLAAFAGSAGDAGLRHALRTRDAADAALFITSDDPGTDREAETAAALRAARRTFDGLPVTLRQFDRSGPYGLPRDLQEPAARAGEPDLAEFGVADRSRVRLTAGAWPAAAADGATEVAVPEAAAKRLRLAPGPRVITLADRLGGPSARIRVTAVYRPADAADPYWRLDELRGRGVHKDAFTTYGPLLADPAALGAGGGITQRTRSWLATADFGALQADDVETLRTAAKAAQEHLTAQEALAHGATARTSLPGVLDRLERALLVSRATLLIVAAQLVLLAAYALLLVARQLGAERVAETQVLMARGASRRRMGALAAVEALLLALPAAVAAPLLAGPLAGLLAGQGLPGRLGLRIETVPAPALWAVAATVAAGCAVAVAAPAITASGAAGGRARALPGPLRAGADIGLLVVAAVAYWQLYRRTSGAGALSGDNEGTLGVDPLLVVAPALALLAGTVLTLRLLPPAARLAERRAARGRGLTASLAGWQLSRRPMRGAGPVLLLVLAVATGMLAIGQGASWDRSQDDQADFRAGAPVRVLGSTVPQFGQGGAYDGTPGLKTAVPAARSTLGLSAGRQATVLALDTGLAGDGLRLRDDLADPTLVGRLTADRPAAGGAGRASAARTGVVLPAGTERLLLDVTLRAADDGPYAQSGSALTVTVEDRYGVPYRLQADTLRSDGRPRRTTVDFAAAAGAPTGRPAGPLVLTAVEFDETGHPDRIAPKRFTIGGLHAVGADGTVRPVAVPEGLGWKATATLTSGQPIGNKAAPAITSVRSSTLAPLDLAYHSGTSVPSFAWGDERTVTVRSAVGRTAPPMPLALATDRFLEAGGAEAGDVIEVPMPGGAIRVRIAGVLRGMPTTGPGADPVGAAAGTASAGSAAAGSSATPADGGALLLDLRAVNRVLATRPGASLPPTEWWMFPEPGRAGQVAAALRDRAESDPGQVRVRDEIARDLHDDPLGAGSRSALLAAAFAASALAAVGFAVSTAGTVRERAREFAVLRALGAPRRMLARLLAVEQALLIGLALAVGLAIGTALTRAVVPLVVLTGQATRPVPGVLVELPAGWAALLLAGVAAAPVLIVAVLALRRGESPTPLRGGDGE